MQTIPGYELLEILGTGPHGIVYKSRHTTKGWVALKIVDAVEAGDFRRVLTLNHPHLATIHDIGHVDSQTFVVTEFLGGGTLKAHMDSLRSAGSVVPSDQILTYATQISEALMYMHSQNVVHGSLKSENIMFSEDRTLKVTDFGRHALPLREGLHSDLVGFGNLLYELTTGRVPSQDATAPVDQFRKDVPPMFTRILSRILNPEQPDGYNDMRGVVADLRSISDSLTATSDIVAARSTPALFPGQILAERFRIVRFIARGGMGDVYEAEDLELREHVALKTIRPEIATEEPAMGRFKREIHLARKVTHPNV